MDSVLFPGKVCAQFTWERVRRETYLRACEVNASCVLETYFSCPGSMWGHQKAALLFLDFARLHVTCPLVPE